MLFVLGEGDRWAAGIIEGFFYLDASHFVLDIDCSLTYPKLSGTKQLLCSQITWVRSLDRAHQDLQSLLQNVWGFNLRLLRQRSMTQMEEAGITKQILFSYICHWSGLIESPSSVWMSNQLAYLWPLMWVGFLPAYWSLICQTSDRALGTLRENVLVIKAESRMIS